VAVADTKSAPVGVGSSAIRTDPLVGRLVAGKFRVQQLIGRGGMGNVYRASQEPLGRIVAIKVLKPDYPEEQDPHFLQRFFLEAAAASKLHHPNTITIYDYGRDDDLLYIVMEFLEGRTLRAMMREVGPVPPGRALHIVRQICKSLREAHQAGLVHRDMKPSNVLLIQRDDDADFVKVLDFGLVKFMDSESDLTKTGTFMGSPKYMAPEQIRRGKCDVRTDIYSVGVLTYQLLSTHVPFDGESVSVLMSHLNDPPPPMAEQQPGLALPARLERAVMRCLEKDPDARFQSMEAMLDELGAIQEELFGERSLNERAVELSPSQIMPAEMIPATPTGKSGAVTTPGGTVAGARSGRGRLAPMVAGALLVLGAIAAGGFFLVGPGAGEGVDEGDGATSSARSGKGGPRAAKGAAAGDTDHGVVHSGDGPTTGAPATPGGGTTEPGGTDGASLALRVDLSSTPPGAEVFDGARSLGLTPLAATWKVAPADAGREYKLEFRLAGRKPVRLSVRPAGGLLHAEAHFGAATSSSAKRPGPKSGGPGGDDYKEDPY
jgi:serine/threonine-protein kinase